VFRYAVFRTSTALPGDLRILLPSLEFLARRRSWVFLTLRRFAPADGWRGISARPGPHVALRAARPPRLIFVGVIDRLHLVFNGKGNRPWTLSWRGVRLLGFDSHLRSASSSSRAGGPILPWALPLAGFAGANLRTRIGLGPRLTSPASGIRVLRVHREARVSQSAHGFAGAYARRARNRSLQRIHGADAWLA
jgi:hypothetical protein